MLWIGCGNTGDDKARPEDPPPPNDSIVWHCFLVAEVPFFTRIFKKVDTAPSLARLDNSLREILSAESEITFVDEP